VRTATTRPNSQSRPNALLFTTAFGRALDRRERR
jgi:hypothetical protein